MEIIDRPTSIRHADFKYSKVIKEEMKVLSTNNAETMDSPGEEGRAGGRDFGAEGDLCSDRCFRMWV